MNKQIQYIIAIICLVLALGLLGFTLYFIPYAFLNAQYSVPLFLEHLKTYLEDHHRVLIWHLQMLIIFIPPLIISGLLLGTAGVVLIFARDLNIALDFNVVLGGLCLLGAVISWAAGSIYWKYKKTDVRPMMGASIQMLIAGVLQTALGLILGEQNNFHLTQNGVLALGYLIVFGSILGYASYIYSVTKLPLSLVSTYAYINPIIAILLGWYVLNEPLTVTVFIASGLILAGVAMVKRGNTLALKK